MMMTVFKSHLKLLAITLTFISSLFLSAGYWMQISSFLVFVAVGLEITKVSIFLEIPNKNWTEKLILILVGLVLSATSIFTSAKQIQHLIHSNSIVTEQSVLDFESKKNERELLQARASLIEKDIAHDIEKNFKTRAERLYRELGEIQNQIASIKLVSPEKAVEAGFDEVSWVLAAILDIIILTLSHLLQQKKSYPSQKTEPKILNDNESMSGDMKHMKKIRENHHKDISKDVRTLIENGHPINLLSLRKTLKADMSKVSCAVKELFNQGFLQKNGRSYTVAV